LLVFIPLCFALNLAFGPNNLLALMHGTQRGVGFAVVASVGRLAVFSLMIAASALGLGLLLTASVVLFQTVKFIGAAYLIWIGFRLLRTAGGVIGTDSAGICLTLRDACRQEGLIAASNPKAILIFAAFFPQFVDTQAYWQSYAALGALFLALEVFAVAIYASAGRFAARFAAARLHWFQRSSGGGMMLFGVLLLFTEQPARS
jgi:threonine/homoserine/homoserine lactone efflux protein